jgi:hypothetical protein
VIKIFNKIRKRLLDENQTGRYLKYAVGEIILVMIGILLALQVNNWNQNRQLQKEEIIILKGLNQEFSENLVRFDTIYKRHEARVNAVFTIMTDNIETYSVKTLDSIHIKVGKAWTFDQLEGIYNSVINSGKLDLISNDSLKTQISKFRDLVIDYKEEELNTLNFSLEQLYPEVISDLPANFQVWAGMRERTEEEKLLHKKEYLKLYRSNSFENKMSFLTAFMQDIFTEGPILRDQMLSIIGLLESEIEKHN